MVPKYDEMYNDFLEILNDGNEHHVREIRDRLAKKLNLSHEDLGEMLKSNKQSKFASRVGWCKTYLLKAKLIDKVKTGVYKITQRGVDSLALNEVIDNKFLQQFAEFNDFVNTKNNELTNEEVKVSSLDSLTPDEMIEHAIAENDGLLRSELKEKIYSMHPEEFEKMILMLLDNMGYAFDNDSLIHTSYTNDGGIDGIIKEDKLGFSKIYIQAKRYTTNNVGRPELQQFLGAVTAEGGNKGLFITSSDFSKDAREFANKQSNLSLVLINGDQLADLMIKYDLGVSVEKTFKVKRIDNDFFNQ